MQLGTTGRLRISPMLLLGVACLYGDVCGAVDPPLVPDTVIAAVDYSDRLPRVAPTEPQDALSSFEIADGYAVQLVAAEPLVRDPVAMSFDEAGRMYVVEMCDYSEQGEERLGSIRLLIDGDQDGRYESSKMFADQLSWPTAIICYDGGVFVGAAPDIWFLKDTDADGVADLRKRVFTGFNRTNVQGLLNSFCWGLDCRVYVQTSSSGGTLSCSETPNSTPVPLSGHDFSFDPKTFSIRLESGGAQHGMCFDDWGHRFASHNSDHLQQFVYSDRYAAKRADDAMPNTRQSIAVDGPQAEVFRISPVEPWRVLRTHLRVSKQVPGLIEGGGRAAGYFTGATGATVYRGDAMPELLGQVFIGDVGSNIVHRKRLIDVGVLFSGRRIDAGKEFIASKDIWFRPVQFANAPDGTIYIADFYREVIEHPASLPPDIKRHLDLTSGRDRGRIYRVMPSHFVHAPPTLLVDTPTAELVTMLRHRNGWHRDTASRMLYQHWDPAIAPLLTALIHETTVVEAKVHAMHLLDRFDSISEATVLTLLRDAHPMVRENAIVIAESRLSRSAEIRSKVIEGLADESPRVRFQSALSLSTLPGRDASYLESVTQMLISDGEDRWLQPAALRAIAREDAMHLLHLLAAKPTTSTTCKSVAAWIGSDISDDELKKINHWIVSEPSLHQKDVLVRAIISALARLDESDEMQRRLHSVAAIQKEWTALIEKARSDARDSSLVAELRLEAIEVLANDRSDATFNVLCETIESPQPKPVQLAVINALSRSSRPEIAERFIAVWPKMIPSVRSSMGRVLVSRNAWIEQLVTAVVDGRVLWSDLEPAVIETIRSSQSSVVKAQLSSISTSLQTASVSREQIVEDYRQSLSIAGNVAAGKVHFQKHCSACHRAEGVGNELGPNLAAFKFRGPDALLLNVLDPNRELNPQFINYIALTKDERIVSGMLTHETATSITLGRGDNAQDTLLLSEIEELKNTQKSLMPEGFEQQLDHKAMADLFTYIMALP